MTNEQGLVKVKGAAKYLDCSPFKVRRLIHDGDLPVVEDHPGAPWRIPVKALDEWIAKHGQIIE
jgi:excisionase family DNA binding protein